jgi:hypothetical protein
MSVLICARADCAHDSRRHDLPIKGSDRGCREPGCPCQTFTTEGGTMRRIIGQLRNDERAVFVRIDQDGRASLVRRGNAPADVTGLDLDETLQLCQILTEAAREQTHDMARLLLPGHVTPVHDYPPPVVLDGTTVGGDQMPEPPLPGTLKTDYRARRTAPPATTADPRVCARCGSNRISYEPDTGWTCAACGAADADETG